MEPVQHGPVAPRAWYTAGTWLLLAGAIAVYSQVFSTIAFLVSHSVFDVVPSDTGIDREQLLILALLVGIGIPAVMLLATSARAFVRRGTPAWGRMAAFAAIASALALNASLLFGGGWIAGSVAGTAGTCLLVFAMVERTRHPATGGRVIRSKRGVLLARRVLPVATCSALAAACLVAVVGGALAVPPPLFTDATGPATSTPDHGSTFYILPIWEWQGDNYTYGQGQMDYMVQTIGGEAYTGNGFVRIGRSVSCWYTSNIFANGSFNPVWLVHKLNLSAITNTPILFHMNGGNWGQHASSNAVIEAMRENVSNCQWDQNDVCHPIRNQPGPNDRFWSFWPGSEWEQFRERNIKQALAIIKNWSDLNPGLLVGFSTDSEIHLNYHDFKRVNVAANGWPANYSSYFDYNNGTIAQYRAWAQANWTLPQFNARCGTAFASWDEVDAPRAPGVVGVAGHPWWETWTDFRIWHVTEAGARQSRWINESGFPREMIWHHQILSEPGDPQARYRRCDPIETAINPHCKLGVTRYGWLSPSTWHALGTAALADGSGDPRPSWGIFEWNLWTQHEYWAYREMLASIYQYGGHVICPNEWVNCSINEGLWIPGDPLPPGVDSRIDDPACTGEDRCCQERDIHGNCTRCRLRHGNPQFQAALRDFVAKAQDYERGTSPHVRVNPWEISWYDAQDRFYRFYGREPGIYIMAGAFLGCVVVVVAGSIAASRPPRAREPRAK